LSESKECLKEDELESQKGKELQLNGSRSSKWKLNIWKSYLFHFFMGFHLISGVLLHFFMNWGKLTFVEIMFLQSYFTVMILLLEIPCGAIADYLSRKLSLTLGAISTALAALIYGIYPNLLIFLIGETLWAFGAALTSGTDQAFIYNTLTKLGKQDEISKVMARNRSFMLFAIAISAPLGSIIAAYLSLNLVMTLMFIPFIIATLISFTFKEPKNELKKKKTDNYFTIIKSGFAELKKNNALRILAFEMILTESLVFFLIWTYQLYLEVLNFPFFLFGFVSAAMTIVQIIFNNLVITLENKCKNKRRFLQAYTIAPGIGFVLMSVIYSIPVSIPLILIVIGFGFSRSLIFIKGINKRIETQNRATVISIINMIASLIRAVLYPIIGYFVMLNLNLIFITSGIIIIIFALLSRIKSEYL